MASRTPPPRNIVPPAGAKKTRPTHIVPGSLHLFTHPAQQVTGPVRAHFARRYNRPGPFGAALFLFDALAAALVLALAVVLGSFILAPGAAAPLRLTVTASATEVRAADTVGFVVGYENRGKLPLENASLALSLPEGFRTTSLEAEGAMDATIEPLTAHGVIPLGTIGPGGNGTVRVAGYMLQREKATSDLRLIATLTGTQKDGRTMQSVSEAVVHVSGSALTLAWAGVATYPDGVPESVADAPAWQTLALRNDGDATLADLVFDPTQVEGGLDHHPISVGPRETLVLGEFVPVQWLMAILASVGGKDVRLASLGYQEPHTTADGPRIEILSATLIGDGRWIDVLARITSTGSALDRGAWRVFPQSWSTVDLSQFPPDPTLEENGLSAGEFTVASGTPSTYGFRIPLKPDVDVSLLTVRATASACVATTDQCAWSSSKRVAVQPAAPTLAAELRYYTEEGEQLGRGPLPPRVAEKTEYWVVVRAEPGLITRDTELRVDLGPNVSYAGKFSASISGVPRQVGNALVWQPDVIVGDGAFTFAAGLAFRPTTDQIDAEAVIVRSIRLLGKDAEGAQTEATTGFLATDVPADPRAREKGTRVSEALE